MKTYNKAEVDELFNENALLIGSRDVIPVDRATLLFGKKAVEYAGKWGVDRSSYGLGEKESIAITFLFRQGFYKAVTYYNIRAMQNIERPANIEVIGAGLQ